MDVKKQFSNSNDDYYDDSIESVDNNILQELEDAQTLQVDPNASFVADFTDGYSFRNMIEYLRTTNSNGNFRFRSEVIYYEQDDASHIIVNQIEINNCELSLYEFNSKASDIVLGVNISDMRAITKTIGKKDSLRIYKLAGDPLLYIQIIGNNSRGTGRQNISVVRPHKVEVVEYKIPEYKRSERYPNCTISSTDFAKMCTSMSSLKCNYVTVYGLPKGVSFEGLTDGAMFGRIERFGSQDYSPNIHSMDSSSSPLRLNNINVPNTPKPRLVIKQTTPLPEDQIKIKIKMGLIKALAKLNNLTNHGMIKIYMEPDNPLKIICQIGNYGTLRIYIRSDDE